MLKDFCLHSRNNLLGNILHLLLDPLRGKKKPLQVVCLQKDYSHCFGCISVFGLNMIGKKNVCLQQLFMRMSCTCESFPKEIIVQE